MSPLSGGNRPRTQGGQGENRPGGPRAGEDRLEHRGHEGPAAGPWSRLKDEVSPHDVSSLPGERQVTVHMDRTGPGALPAPAGQTGKPRDSRDTGHAEGWPQQWGHPGPG